MLQLNPEKLFVHTLMHSQTFSHFYSRHMLKLFTHKKTQWEREETLKFTKKKLPLLAENLKLNFFSNAIFLQKSSTVFYLDFHIQNLRSFLWNLFLPCRKWWSGIRWTAKKFIDIWNWWEGVGITWYLYENRTPSNRRYQKFFSYHLNFGHRFVLWQKYYDSDNNSERRKSPEHKIFRYQERRDL